MTIRRLTFHFASLLLAFAATDVSAQDTLYWNPTGSTTAQGGSGTIDATTPLWNTSSTPSATLEAWTNGNHAVFAGSGGTITSDNLFLNTGNVAFRTNPYTLQGDLNLNITDGNFIVESLGALTVNDALSINADLALYNGTLNVSGGAFTTTTNGYIGVDGSSNGRLNISDGGEAGFVSNSVGTLASSYGFITVDGAGSTFTNSGNLYIGQNGYGELTVSNGAAATANDAYLGYADGANGYVTVTGAGSTLTVSTSLNVGSADGGIGSLTVAEGGLVKVTGGNDIFLRSGSTLTIGMDNGAAGTVQANAIVGVTGSTLVFDHSEVAYDFSIATFGHIGVQHLGSGTTTLSHVNDYAGGTILTNGTLRLGVDQALGGESGDITMDGGTLDLNGHEQASNLLYVTSDSVIDFGGDSSLALANSSAIEWTGLLTILNFGVGDTFRIGTDGDGLTGTQLNQIIIGGFYAQIDTSGYISASAISAVPEPSTYAMIAGAGALGLAAWRRHKVSRNT